MNDFEPLPSVSLTLDQKKEFRGIMVKGGTLLKSIHLKAKSNFKKANKHTLSEIATLEKQAADYIEKFIKNGATETEKDEQAKRLAKIDELSKHCRFARSKFRIELFKALNNKPRQIELHGVTVTKEQAKVLLAVRNIEYSMLCGYAKLIYKQARKFQQIVKLDQRSECNLSFEDFYNEAVMAVVNSIYCYCKPTIKFITYATYAIHRRMLTVLNESKPLSHWTNRAQKLYGQFKKECIKADGPISFDTLVGQMKLTDKQRHSLEAMLTKVMRGSEIAPNNSEQDGEGFDYTGLSGKQEEHLKLDVDMRDAIAKANLDEWEMAVLQAFKYAKPGSNGWRSEVAQKYINPETGKRYSRAAPKIALERIKKKIIEAYESQAA